jgi:hypothetical protein
VPPFRAAQIVGARFAFFVSLAHVKDRLKQGDGVFESGLGNRRQITLLGFTSTDSQLSTQVAVNYGSSLQIQRRSPASERLLLPMEFRHNELAEFHSTGRNVTIGDPPYA